MTDGVEISRRLVAINAASSVLRSVLSLSVLLWVQAYLIQAIPKEQYTIYPPLMAVMIAVSVLTALLVSGLGRFIIEAYARQNAAVVTALVSTAFPVLVVAALLVLGLGWLAARNVGSILVIAPEWEDDACLMLGLLMSTAALQVVCAPFCLGFTVRQRFLLRNMIALGTEVVRIGILFALLLGVGPRVLWVAVASSSGAILELVVVCWISSRLAPALRYRRGMFQPDLLRQMLSFGGWIVVSRMASLLRESADPIILNRMATAVDVNALYLGTVIDVNYRRTVFQMATTALPAFTAMHATEQAERLRRSYLQMSRIMLWLMLGVTVPMMLYREEFFALYLLEKASLYGDAATVMLLYAARSTIIFPNAPLGLVTVAMDRIRPQAACSLAIELVNLALTLYLVGVRGYGAIGAAASTFAVTIVFYPTLFWTLGLRLTGTKLRDWLAVAVRPGVLPALAALPVWAGLRYWSPPASWLALCAQGAAGGAVYLTVLIVFGLEDRDRQRLRRMIGSVFSRP